MLSIELFGGGEIVSGFMFFTGFMYAMFLRIQLKRLTYIQ